MPPIAVTIIEDHADFREGLSHLLRCTDRFVLSASFGSLEEALASPEWEADVILLDIRLPGRSGIEGIRLVKDRLPQAQIIMVTVFDDDDNIFNAILTGADGYILKKTPPARILQAILDANTGGTPMSPHVARKVIEFFRQKPAQEKLTPPGNELSPRESEVLKALVDGFDTQGIAERLFISTETVRNHLKHIYGKLHVHTRAPRPSLWQ